MNIVLIAADPKMDQFMHVFDVFEGSKKLAWPKMYTIEGDIKPENRGKVVEKFREASEEFGYEVVACFSPGSPDGAFVLEGVNTISNGHKWAMLDKVLETYNYVSEAVAIQEGC